MFHTFRSLIHSEEVVVGGMIIESGDDGGIGEEGGVRKGGWDEG